MGLGSQVSNVDTISTVGGLVHEVFANKVKPSIWKESVTRQVIQSAGADDYSIEGEKLVGAADLRFAGGALGTDGKLPDHQYTDAVPWEVTPVRLYIRRAVDNFIQARATGKGAFEDFTGRVFDQQWDAFSRMEIRHACGGSSGVIGLCDSRTSGTVFVIKDGYGHTGTDPLMFLEPGMVIAWIDVNDSNAEAGAATIESINYSTRAITVDAEATWEPGNDIAAGDKIVFATTPNIATDYFDTEFNSAPQGLMDIIDPDAAASTVQNIAEATYPRWKPYRVASSTFDHIEVTEFFQKLRAKSTSPVGMDTHTCITNGAVLAELARTLIGFQQQMGLGKTLEGGYETVRVANMDFAQDDFQLHNVLYAICHEDIFAADLDGDADYFSEDGSQFSRLSDFDGKEWYVKHYKQVFADRRNRFGALTGITLSNVSATDFTPTPNY